MPGILFLSVSGYSQTNINNLPADASEKILEIGFDSGGNESGSSILKIREDSTFYQRYSPYEKTIKSKRTEKAEWHNLIHTINLADFDNLISGKNQRKTDGLDIQVYIKTLKRTYFKIIDQTNYKKIAAMMNGLMASEKGIEEPERVLEIQFHEEGGGKWGGEDHLIITKDSLLFDSRNRHTESKKRIHIPHKFSSVDNNAFDELLNLIDLKDFDATKDGPSVQDIDEADQVILIKTTRGFHEKMNGVFTRKTKPLLYKLRQIRDDLLTHF